MARSPSAAWLSLSVLLGGCASHNQIGFPTPNDAVQALVDSATDPKLAEDLLGPGGFDLLRSGDEVADREDLEVVRAMIQQQVAFEDVGDGRKIALLGEQGWELPIPLVEIDGVWRFDVAAGREEILNRRIGRNELSTIETLRELVEAQREYAAEGRDGNPPAYARKLWSSDGKRDGLYWPVAEGEPESPMGPFVAEAADDGYERASGGPQPYHGYRYRMLTAQGAHAPGGARSYLDDKGLLTRGFAVIAWPATYGNSGVMTFVTNQQGIVFERDFGADTERAVARISSYDPNPNWSPVHD